MITIKVKTLDSNNYDFLVEENISVKDFKDLITSKVNISPDLQKLIFCGRVLDDNKLLKDYEINDGKVVHLVRRQPTVLGPIGTGTGTGSAPNSSQSSPGQPRRRPNGRNNEDNSYLVGAFSIPQEAFNPNSFQQILQNVVSNMGEVGRNATVMSRTSEDGSSVDVQINLAQMPPQNESRHRIALANRLLGYINAIIDVIERPDRIPGTGVEANTNGTFNIDANNMGSLEAQLAAQAAAQSFAAASNAFGVPPPHIIIQGPNQTTVRVSQPVNPNQNNENRNSNNNNTNTRNRSETMSVGAAQVNEIFESVFTTQERLRPHIQRYQQLMTIEEPLTEEQSAEAQSLQRNVMRANHHLAHVFHLISDLVVNFNTANRTVGVIQSLTTQTSMESVSVSVPFRQPNTDQSGRSQASTASTATNSNTASTQPMADVAATAGSTTYSTTSVPRFSQSHSGNQSSSVFVAQSPIVVMEVGSHVERIPISIPNAQRAEPNQPNNTTPTARPLFIPPFDPYLQCNSPFTIPEIRTRVSVGISAGRNGRQTQNNNTDNNNEGDNQTTNIPFASLGQIVNGILSGFLGQTTTGPEPNRNTSANTNNTGSEPSVNVDPTLIDLMGRLNNQRPTNESNGEDMENNSMTDMFMAFVNGILQIISGGQTNAINVADFLTRLEGFSYTEGDNIANDVFMVMARVLNFQNLFHIFGGNSEPLNRVREPIKRFAETSILRGRQPTRENIDDAIDAIINSWRPGIEIMSSGLTLLPGINLMATIQHFLRFNLNRILNLFLSPPHEEYGNTFFAIIREFFIDLISLSQVCFTDGVLALQQLMGAFIEHISCELNPAIQEWMRSVAIRHLNEYINNNNTEQSPNTETYLVRDDINDTTVGAVVADPAAVKTDETSEAENVEFIDAESDWTEEPILTNTNNSSVQMEASFNEIPVVIGTESWHSSVPSDWVPIITTDLERQRRLGLQRPFSDAYLNSVSKKRKIEKRPINLRDSLRNALSTSGVRPIGATNSEEVINEITVNSSLNNSFDDLVRNVITDRIVSDDDYINARTQTPERFSNSNNYFNSKS